MQTQLEDAREIYDKLNKMYKKLKNSLKDFWTNLDSLLRKCDELYLLCTTKSSDICIRSGYNISNPVRVVLTNIDNLKCIRITNLMYKINTRKAHQQRSDEDLTYSAPNDYDENKYIYPGYYEEEYKDEDDLDD